MKAWAPALLIGLMSLAASRSRAEETADSLIAQGVALRKQGRDAEALIDFQRADQLNPSAGAEAQIALAQQALGQWVAAEDGLGHALAMPSDAFITRNRAPLMAALETIRDHLGSLRVESNVAASVFVDGKPIGRSPSAQPLRVAVGHWMVELRAEGFETVQRALTVEPRSEARLQVELSRVPPSAAMLAPPPKLSPVAPVTLGVAPASGAINKPAASGLHTAAVVTLAGGGVLLAGAVTAHVLREWYASRYNDESFCPPRDREQRCSAYLHGAHTTQSLAIVGYSAAGAALLTSLILFVAAPNEAPSLAAIGGDGSLGWYVAF